MFEVGDLVLYGMQGVCRVGEILTRTADGTDTRYYSLAPYHAENSVFFVPVDSEELSARIRPLLPREEVLALLEELPALETVWVPEQNARRERFKRILLAGERRELGALIKTLYRHRELQRSKGKKLHISDERYLKSAERALFTEFAVVLGKEFSEIAQTVAAKLAQ